VFSLLLNANDFVCGLLPVSTDPHAGNLGVEIMNMDSTKSEERVRLVYYDFGQAAELQQNQADGILDIIEAIVDMDVDKSITSFQKMGVLKDDADLVAVRQKVAENYRTGKVKANRKKLRKSHYKFKNDDDSIVTFTNSTSNTTTTNDDNERRSSDAIFYLTSRICLCWSRYYPNGRCRKIIGCRF
jgi:predicted unusual protein kinase regulating ubiquinone biosynthesis (AarF/ABC1/UbiB family)